MQTDGKLVWHAGSTPLWASGTSGEAGNYTVMQSDGNLVLYNSSNSPIWATQTYAYTDSSLAVQNDGNLVIYSDSDSAVWAYSWMQIAAGAQAYAQAIMSIDGWSASSQYSYLDDLWTRESNWEWNVDNPSSGAYGIPQALPASKMAAAGPDYVSDGLTQVQRGLTYILNIYGTPYNAWEHELGYGVVRHDLLMSRRRIPSCSIELMTSAGVTRS
ncbi:MAG TPA: hypothetical protein VGL60_05115 [Acidimicrobiales bacterium]